MAGGQRESRFRLLNNHLLCGVLCSLCCAGLCWAALCFVAKVGTQYPPPAEYMRLNSMYGLRNDIPLLIVCVLPTPPRFSCLAEWAAG